MEYYVLLGKTKAGPYSVGELKEKNLLGAEVMISLTGTGEWVKVKDVPELLVAAQEEKVKNEPVVASSEEKEVPKSWIIEAVVGIFLFFPLGLIAFLYALKVEPAFNKGREEQAKKYSLKARNWAVVSYIVGIVLFWLIKGMA